MSERPPKKGAENESDHLGHSEGYREVVARYLESLALTKQDLAGKTILDMGAGSGRFAQGVKEEVASATVMSLDYRLGNFSSGPSEDMRVVSKAQSLPFPDNVFDYAISVNALPHIAHMGLRAGTLTGETHEGSPVYRTSKEDLEEYSKKIVEIVANVVTESVRVVKPGGEVRFGGVPLSGAERKEVVEGMERGVLESGIQAEILWSGEGKKRWCTYVLKKPKLDFESV